MTFLHTADWQLGRPFAGVADPHKRSLLQNERFATIRRLGEIARHRGARFILVAGDLFDSPTVTRPTVAAACSAIGSCQLPVLVIPGNHDHGGPGSLWEQDFFLGESRKLAPNLRVLTRPVPVELDGALILPCPLLRRHETADPTAWLRHPEALAHATPHLPRILLAHGSVIGFDSSDAPDGEGGGESANRIDLGRLPHGVFDYAALGDWHGTRQVGPAAWYSGTPEPDRFTKGGGHDPGNVLLVDVAQGQPPQVERIPTGSVRWHRITHRFTDDAGLEPLESAVDAAIGARANLDVLHLELDGVLGIAASATLEARLESWHARLLDLRTDHRVAIAPSDAEIDALTRRSDDPLLSRVAARLVALASAPDTQSDIARVALRELHAACTRTP